jgi:hypothetical protein
MYKLLKPSLIVLSSVLIYNTLYAGNCEIPQSQHASLDKVCYEATGNENCLFTWKGYQWWLDYNAVPDPEFPNNNWWIRYKWDQGQGYDPRFAKVVNGELELKIAKSDLGGGQKEWNSSEVVLVADGSGNPLGYGHYYAVIYAPPGFANLDDNSVFGLFTYLKNDNKKPNNHNEIDMLEISKWGGKANVEKAGVDRSLMPIMYNDPPNENDAHAQIGLQPWHTWPTDNNFKKYPIPAEIKTITAYMYWNGKENEKSIHLKVFKGNIPFEQVKQDKGDLYDWATSKENEKYIPNNEDCTRLHINFYLQHTYCKIWTNKEHKADPLGRNKESELIIVKDFMYEPLN